MICRRGGLDKHQIGAIRIYDAHTEFEISAQASEEFVVRIKSPDKEAHIRIEALPEGPQGQTPSDKPSAPTMGNKEYDRRPRQNDKPRHEHKPKHHEKPSGEAPPWLDHKPRFEKKQPHGKPAYAGKHKRDGSAPLSKPAFGKKRHKNKHGG